MASARISFSVNSWNDFGIWKSKRSLRLCIWGKRLAPRAWRGRDALRDALPVRPAAAHLRQHKGRVRGLRPEGAKELSPGFQPWVTATQKRALKVAPE